MVERAKRAAQSENSQTLSLIAGMLRMALNSVDGEALPVEKFARRIVGIHGDGNVKNNVNIETE